ncbi:MAG: hypothetical protein WCJ19_02115 [bacterium]
MENIDKQIVEKELKTLNEKRSFIAKFMSNKLYPSIAVTVIFTIIAAVTAVILFTNKKEDIKVIDTPIVSLSTPEYGTIQDIYDNTNTEASWSKPTDTQFQWKTKCGTSEEKVITVLGTMVNITIAKSDRSADIITKLDSFFNNDIFWTLDTCSTQGTTGQKGFINTIDGNRVITKIENQTNSTIYSIFLEKNTRKNIETTIQKTSIVETTTYKITVPDGWKIISKNNEGITLEKDNHILTVDTDTIYTGGGLGFMLNGICGGDISEINKLNDKLQSETEYISDRSICPGEVVKNNQEKNFWVGTIFENIDSSNKNLNTYGPGIARWKYFDLAQPTKTATRKFSIIYSGIKDDGTYFTKEDPNHIKLLDEMNNIVKTVEFKKDGTETQIDYGNLEAIYNNSKNKFIVSEPVKASFDYKTSCNTGDNQEETSSNFNGYKMTFSNTFNSVDDADNSISDFIKTFGLDYWRENECYKLAVPSTTRGFKYYNNDSRVKIHFTGGYLQQKKEVEITVYYQSNKDLPDVYAGWKTYSNNEFLINFKYPNNYTLNESVELSSQSPTGKMLHISLEKGDYLINIALNELYTGGGSYVNLFGLCNPDIQMSNYVTNKLNRIDAYFNLDIKNCGNIDKKALFNKDQTSSAWIGSEYYLLGTNSQAPNGFSRMLFTDSLVEKIETKGKDISRIKISIKKKGWNLSNPPLLPIDGNKDLLTLFSTADKIVKTLDVK